MLNVPEGWTLITPKTANKIVPALVKFFGNPHFRPGFTQEVWSCTTRIWEVDPPYSGKITEKRISITPAASNTGLLTIGFSEFVRIPVYPDDFEFQTYYIVLGSTVEFRIYDGDTLTFIRSITCNQ